MTNHEFIATPQQLRIPTGDELLTITAELSPREVIKAIGKVMQPPPLPNLAGCNNVMDTLLDLEDDAMKIVNEFKSLGQQFVAYQELAQQYRNSLMTMRINATVVLSGPPEVKQFIEIIDNLLASTISPNTKQTVMDAVYGEMESRAYVGSRPTIPRTVDANAESASSPSKGQTVQKPPPPSMPPAASPKPTAPPPPRPAPQGQKRTAEQSVVDLEDKKVQDEIDARKNSVEEAYRQPLEAAKTTPPDGPIIPCSASTTYPFGVPAKPDDLLTQEVHNGIDDGSSGQFDEKSDIDVDDDAELHKVHVEPDVVARRNAECIGALNSPSSGDAQRLDSERRSSYTSPPPTQRIDVSRSPKLEHLHGGNADQLRGTRYGSSMRGRSSPREDPARHQFPSEKAARAGSV